MVTVVIILESFVIMEVKSQNCRINRLLLNIYIYIYKYIFIIIFLLLIIKSKNSFSNIMEKKFFSLVN